MCEDLEATKFTSSLSINDAFLCVKRVLWKTKPTPHEPVARPFHVCGAPHHACFPLLSPLMEARIDPILHRNIKSPTVRGNLESSKRGYY